MRSEDKEAGLGRARMYFAVALANGACAVALLAAGRPVQVVAGGVFVAVAVLWLWLGLDTRAHYSEAP